MDKCVRDARLNDCGLMIGESKVSVLLYADDAVLVSDSAVELQTMLSRLNEAL